MKEEKDIVRGYVIPLYTAPPKREPLSDEEIYALDKFCHRPFELYCVRDCISWIRRVEKAHGIGGGNENI